MNKRPTPNSAEETKMVLLYLAKKAAKLLARWSLYLFVGFLAWLLFEPLPPMFFWGTLVMMMAAMSIHSILHQRDKMLSMHKQICRFAFFMSFPLLFIFVGNRVTNWVAADEPVSINEGTIMPNALGAIPSEEYLIYKELKKEGFKNPAKTKNGIKQIIKSKLKKAKDMDKATKVILIVFGAILLLLIIFAIAVIWAVNDTAESCSGSSGGSSSSSSCCL